MVENSSMTEHVVLQATKFGAWGKGNEKKNSNTNPDTWNNTYLKIHPVDIPIIQYPEVVVAVIVGIAAVSYRIFKFVNQVNTLKSNVQGNCLRFCVHNE